ncbi:MAG: leucine-rich repeat domain-containing protein [Alphaproteobacteria bacterium]
MADMTEGERIAEERIAEAARTGQDWLDLGDLGLKRLPNSLSKLTKLERLSLGRFRQVTAEGVNHRKGLHVENTFSDVGVISSLSELRELHIEGTQVSDLTPIKNLLLLQHLDCSDPQVSDLTPIKGLLQLQHLDCSLTQVSDLTPIKGLLQLQHLRCRGTKISDLTPIKGLLQLQHLDCIDTRVSDLTPSTGLLQLQRLYCSLTQVSDLTPIKGLLQLQRLYCSDTRVSDLTPIAGLFDLEYVDAENCSVGFVPNTIKNLKKLALLDLSQNKIKRLPRELGELGALETLSIEGNPLEDPLPELIAPGHPQATINVLRWLRGEPIEPEATEPDPPAPEERADDPPAIPEQGAGPRVVLDQTGRLVFAKPSDLDAKGNDRNRLEALHPALREAAANLIKALQDHPSNLLNERLLQKAEAYRALVDLPLDEVNFARLYGAGMQLLNAAAATRRALEAGRVDVPELTPVQDECIANIENLHPPFVLASRDGQEMLADQTTIKLTAEAVEGIKEAGTELGAELINDPDLADREVGETIRDAAAEIEQGENEARDAVNTVSTMRNAVIVLTTASKWAIIPTAVGFAAGGPLGAVAAGGASLWWYGTKVAEKTKAFQADADRAAKALDAEAEKLPIIRNRMARHQRLLLKVEPKLRKITQLPGFTWLGPSLDWLKRNSPPDKKE